MKIFNQLNYVAKKVDLDEHDIDVGPKILDETGYMENEVLIKNLLTNGLNGSISNGVGVYDEDDVDNEEKQPVRLKDINIRNVADYLNYSQEGKNDRRNDVSNNKNSYRNETINNVSNNNNSNVSSDEINNKSDNKTN